MNKGKDEKESLIEKVIKVFKLIGETKKRKSKNEFRYNNKTGHPNYIFEEENGKYHSIGITHRSETFGIRNIPLNENPQKTKKGEPANLRTGIISEKKNNYSKKPNKNMSFSKDDFPNVKSKVRNYKRNRKKKTNG